MRKLICIITVCFMVITSLTGCAVLQKLGLQKDEGDELHPASSVVMGEDEAKKLTDKVPVHLYFANEDNTKLKMEVRYIPMTEAKKSVSNLATVIVKELIKGPTQASVKATIPASAQLRAPVTINARVATVDFTQAFIDKHPGGKEAEQATIYSIVNSLTELKEIEKVKFLVNGKVRKDFKGSFQFDAPFPRSANLISKVTSLPASSNTSTATNSNKEADKSKPTDTKKVDTKKDSAKATTNDKSKETAQKVEEAKDTMNPEVSEEDAEATYLEILE